MRCKDGKERQYWSIEEKRRPANGRAVDRRVLYLGELNDTQQAHRFSLIPEGQGGCRGAGDPSDRETDGSAARGPKVVPSARGDRGDTREEFVNDQASVDRRRYSSCRRTD
jgi:hypothetical protein